MESFLLAIGVVAFAEIADKSQFIAFVLGARFKRPFLVILAITCAIIANHGLVAVVGVWLTRVLSPKILHWIIGLLFLGMAIWARVPEKNNNHQPAIKQNFGIVGTTFMAFFLAEMGDKSQIATLAMTAYYEVPILVVTGTVIGMLLANVPAVFIGDKLAVLLPMQVIRWIIATVFAVLGVAAIFSLGTD